jgi:hypothetical protein
MCGLTAVAATLGVPNPALEPDDIRYFCQLREFLSAPLVNWKNVFVITNSWEDHWWIEPGHVSYVRPIPILTYLGNILLFGESARALLFINTLLFFVLCLSVTRLLAVVTTSRFASTLAACWFATLPIHSEGVAYIAGRTDVLAWTFGTLLLRSHLLRQNYFRRSLFFLLALMSKEYCLLLPVICFSFDYYSFSRSRIGELRQYFPYLLITAVYLPLHYILLGGGSLQGAPHPLYFPVTSLGGAFYHLVLQSLSFISLSIIGLYGTTYSTVISKQLIFLSAASLPCFLVVLFAGRGHALFRPVVGFLLITLVAIAPLYVSNRYFIGPSVAFACCLSLYFERFTWRREQGAVLCVAIPLLAFHVVLLSFGLWSNIDYRYRFKSSVTAISDILHQKREDLLQCDVLLVANAPSEQVFQMFLSEFFQHSVGRSDIQTVIISHRPLSQEGNAKQELSLLIVTDGLELSGLKPLVSEASADVELKLFGAPVDRRVGSHVQISVDSTWRVLKAAWAPSTKQRVCALEFAFEPTLSLKTTPIS